MGAELKNKNELTYLILTFAYFRPKKKLEERFFINFFAPKVWP